MTMGLASRFLALSVVVLIGCSRSPSSKDSRVRFLDRANQVKIESALAAPQTLAQLHKGSDPLIDSTVRDAVARFGGVVPEARFADQLWFGNDGVLSLAAPNLSWIAVSDDSLRVREVRCRWGATLGLGEGLFVLDVPRIIRPEELSSARELETLLRSHATFVQRIPVDVRFADEPAYSCVREPDSSPSTTLVFAVTRGEVPPEATLQIMKLADEQGWLASTAGAGESHEATRTVLIGNVAREAFVLGKEGSVSLELVMPQKNPRFRFFLGARGLPAPQLVQIKVRVDNQEKTDSWSGFDFSKRVGSDGWVEVDRAFEQHFGQRVRISIDLRADRMPAGATLLLGEPVVEGEGTSETLDVLVVSLDTTRADRMSLYGHSRKTTPNLDRLAQSSVVFDRASSTAPWTLPSHVSLFSAQYPDRHGVIGPASRIPRELPWLPRIARDEGYATFAVTGGGYVNAEFGFARGFELYSVSDPAYPNLEWATAKGDRVSEELARRALGEKNELLFRLAERPDHPSFAFVHTYAAHNYGAPPAVLTGFGVARDAVARLVALDPTKRDWELASPRNPSTDQALEDARLVYDASVVTADALVGEIVAKLEATGRLDRTILVVVSDHGEELGDREGFGHGQSVFQEQIHVPLLIRVPGMTARRIADPVSLVDVAPTLCELLGWPAMNGDGRSLVPFLRGESLDPRPVLARGNRRDTVFRAVRGRKEKLIETVTPGLEPRRTLFELEKDPSEATDVAAARSEVRDKLATLLSRTVADQRAKGSGASDVSISAELEAQLRQLGYLGGN